MKEILNKNVTILTMDDENSRFFGWILLSVLTLDVLSLWIRPYMNVATAAFYLEVTGRADMMPKPEA